MERRRELDEGAPDEKEPESAKLCLRRNYTAIAL